jgi:hypothetical protein
MASTFFNKPLRSRVETARLQLNITLREYNTTYGFTLQGNHRSRRGEILHRGGDLSSKIERDVEPELRVPM